MKTKEEASRDTRLPFEGSSIFRNCENQRQGPKLQRQQQADKRSSYGSSGGADVDSGGWRQSPNMDWQNKKPTRPSEPELDWQRQWENGPERRQNHR